MHRTLIARIIGFVASLILTVAAFIIVIHPDFFSLTMQMNILAIFLLAILQFIVQSVCFLKLLEEKGPRWNLFVYLSTISIVLVIVIFSIWIMHHLDYNMMPHMMH